LKKRTTIQRQLIITVITPVVFLIVGIGFYNFYEEREAILDERVDHIKQVKQEVNDFIDFFDQTILEFESEMSRQGRMFSDTLVNHIFKDSKYIETLDLDSLRMAIGMSKSQDLYIINRNGVIVNTTYPKDLGLNFFEMGDFFVDHFNNVWDSGEFIEDRISIEMSTKAPKKYTYHSTLDKQYVVEIGMYSEQTQNIVQLFTDKLNTIADKYIDIDTISLFFGTEKFINYQGHTITKKEKEDAKVALEKQHEVYSHEEVDGVKHTRMFLYLDIDELNLSDGYIVRILYNNLREQQLIKAQLLGFGILMFLFIIPMIVLIYWRAKVISKPISILNAKVGEIQSGNMKARVPVIGNNEVTQLSEHFNDMMFRLKESHDTLEDKVKERTEELTLKNAVIESTHKEIQDSINYAKRLQKAILPAVSDIKDHLPESFVYFKPKDVVSGDFYWFEHHKGYDYIAAADCTGHGVPGALVSVVCNNALHRSLYEFSKISLDNMINNTRDIIIETFSKTEIGIKDGMDISICRVDKKNNEFQFVGANNPLWIVRKTEDLTDDEKGARSTVMGDEFSMIEVKGDKQPVGMHEQMESFNCSTIKYKKGDVIYMFSDGYADQFGGPKGKKLMYKPFKKTLLKNSQLPMEEQKTVLNDIFMSWKDSIEQVDDVVIIGVRL
jgi:serine phosphatase RsbU (regulator of sigma subunit)